MFPFLIIGLKVQIGVLSVSADSSGNNESLNYPQLI